MIMMIISFKTDADWATIPLNRTARLTVFGWAILDTTQEPEGILQKIITLSIWAKGCDHFWHQLLSPKRDGNLSQGYNQ